MPSTALSAMRRKSQTGTSRNGARAGADKATTPPTASEPSGGGERHLVRGHAGSASRATSGRRSSLESRLQRVDRHENLLGASATARIGRMRDYGRSVTYAGLLRRFCRRLRRDGREARHPSPPRSAPERTRSAIYADRLVATASPSSSCGAASARSRWTSARRAILRRLAGARRIEKSIATISDAV